MAQFVEVEKFFKKEDKHEIVWLNIDTIVNIQEESWDGDIAVTIETGHNVTYFWNGSLKEFVNKYTD